MIVPCSLRPFYSYRGLNTGNSTWNGDPCSWVGSPHSETWGVGKHGSPKEAHALSGVWSFWDCPVLPRFFPRGLSPRGGYIRRMGYIITSIRSLSLRILGAGSWSFYELVLPCSLGPAMLTWSAMLTFARSPWRWRSCMASP